MVFAVREAVQESLGFSPADLVFRHTPRGPLKVLKENILSSKAPTSVPKNVYNYVHEMCNRLHDACELAHQSLLSVQSKMKNRYDKKAKIREFREGDKVLVLLPVQGSSLSARYTSPHVVERKLSDTIYVVRTPERRRSSRLCHVNMLKEYYVRKPLLPSVQGPAVVATAVLCSDSLEDNQEDGLEPKTAHV